MANVVKLQPHLNLLEGITTTVLQIIATASAILPGIIRIDVVLLLGNRIVIPAMTASLQWWQVNHLLWAMHRQMDVPSVDRIRNKVLFHPPCQRHC